MDYEKNDNIGGVDTTGEINNIGGVDATGEINNIGGVDTTGGINNIGVIATAAAAGKYVLKAANLTVEATPSEFRYAFILPGGDRWEMRRTPFIRKGDGTVLPFPKPASVSLRHAGTGDVLKVIYSGFEGSGIRATALLQLDGTTGDAVFRLNIEGDSRFEFDTIQFPAPLEFGAQPGHGYTVLSQMQGTLYPAGEKIIARTGFIYERDGYMPIFGQVRDGSGYAAIFETPYDVRYDIDEDRVRPLWRHSLGQFRYSRTVRYCFRDNCDYNVIARCYREYLTERGLLVTLKEKFARNPKAERILGLPVIHSGIAAHIAPESMFYDKEHPENNDWHTTFDIRAQELRELKARGLDAAYTHFDGWGKHGYDNLHPSPFPPSPDAGGAEGMKRLADTCAELGYIFGIHDQYRDYYYDNPDFCIDEAVTYADGSHPFHDVWNGGAHSFLCSVLAPDYVRRNYAEFKKLGINVEAAYLDVFSVVEQDECYHPDHPATREDCARNRRHCLDILTEQGIIPSSEEATDCIIPSMILCHHAPMNCTDFGYELDNVGIPIPLLTLVYHDCLIVPWIGLPGERSGWCIPKNDSAYGYAILYGQPVYCPMNANEEEIKAVKLACANAKRIAHEQMVRHEFVGDGYRVQRTTFSDGTVITVNMDSGEFEICPGTAADDGGDDIGVITGTF